MARLNINIGTTANDKTGDPLRTAFDKVNQNFVELYALANADVQIPSQTGNSNKFLTTNGTTLSWTSISQEVGTANTGFVDDRIYNLNGVIVSNDDLVHGATARLTIPEYGDTVNPITLYNNYGNISILNGSGGVISNTWTFGTDGNTILPESTVPVTLAGKVGDKAGTVAIDGNYIYYCTTDYVGGGGGGGTVTLVPNELGQNVNTLTITKGAPPNTGWATPQVGWTLTVNSTTVTIEQIDDLGTDISIIVSGFITLPPTGSVTFVEGGGVQPDIWVKQKWGVDPVVPTDISQLTDTTNLLTNTGDITFVDNIISGPNQQNSIILDSGSNSVVIGSGDWNGGGFDGFQFKTDLSPSENKSWLISGQGSTGHRVKINSAGYAGLMEFITGDDLMMKIGNRYQPEERGIKLYADLTFSAGGAINVKSSVPIHSYGVAGDKLGMIALDSNYIYYCKQDYVDNSTNIWVRVSWSADTW